MGILDGRIVSGQRWVFGFTVGMKEALCNSDFLLCSPWPPWLRISLMPLASGCELQIMLEILLIWRLMNLLISLIFPFQWSSCGYWWTATEVGFWWCFFWEIFVFWVGQYFSKPCQVSPESVFGNFMLLHELCCLLEMVRGRMLTTINIGEMEKILINGCYFWKRAAERPKSLVMLPFLFLDLVHYLWAQSEMAD